MDVNVYVLTFMAYKFTTLFMLCSKARAHTLQEGERNRLQPAQLLQLMCSLLEQRVWTLKRERRTRASECNEAHNAKLPVEVAEPAVH